MLGRNAGAVLVVVVAGVLLAAAATPSAAAQEAGLTGVEWQLVEIQDADGSSGVPTNPADYTLLLGDDGVASGAADCNLFSGDYTSDGAQISFGVMASTAAACPPGSLSDAYLAAIGTASSFEASGATLAISYDGGTLIFSASASGLPATGSGGLGAAKDASGLFGIAALGGGAAALLAITGMARTRRRN